MNRSDKYEIVYKLAICVSSIAIMIRAFSNNITSLDFYMTLVFIGLSCIGCGLLIGYRDIENKKAKSSV